MQVSKPMRRIMHRCYITVVRRCMKLNQLSQLGLAKQFLAFKKAQRKRVLQRKNTQQRYAWQHEFSQGFQPLEQRVMLSAASGFVWFDANANGLQDQSETGIAAVTVNLLDSAGVQQAPPPM